MIWGFVLRSGAYFNGARFEDPRWEVFLLLDGMTTDAILSSPREAQLDHLTAVQVGFPGPPNFSQWITEEEKTSWPSK